jgi:hypothetical protein
MSGDLVLNPGAVGPLGVLLKVLEKELRVGTNHLALNSSSCPQLPASDWLRAGIQKVQF